MTSPTSQTVPETAPEQGPRHSPVCLPGDPALLRWFGWLVAGIGVAAFLGMTATTLLGVAARYLGLRGVDWSFEVSAILFLWTSFFGVVLAELRKENVAFTLLSDRLSGVAGKVLGVICALLVLWFAISLCHSGIAFAERSGSAPTPVLRLPRLVQILPLIIFAGGTAAIIIVRLVHDLVKGRRT